MVWSLRDTPEWQMGHTTEKRVALLMQRCGWHVSATYDFTGEEGNKAPKAIGDGVSVVLPDLQCMRHGETRWVEVKSKTSANLRRNPHPHAEHGIDERHWNDYLRIQEVSGCPVHLLIFEQDTDDTYVASCASLVGRERRGRWPHNNALSVNWPRRLFTRFEDSDFFPPNVVPVHVPRTEAASLPVGQYAFDLGTAEQTGFHPPVHHIPSQSLPPFMGARDGR